MLNTWVTEEEHLMRCARSAEIKVWRTLGDPDLCFGFGISMQGFCVEIC